MQTRHKHHTQWASRQGRPRPGGQLMKLAPRTASPRRLESEDPARTFNKILPRSHHLPARPGQAGPSRGGATRTGQRPRSVEHTAARCGQARPDSARREARGPSKAPSLPRPQPSFPSRLPPRPPRRGAQSLESHTRAEHAEHVEPTFSSWQGAASPGIKRPVQMAD